MQLTHSAPDRRLRKRLAPAGGLVYATVAVSLALVFWLDWITGSAPLQHLYYLPIILASLRVGALAGFGVAVSAIGLYHVANPTIIEAGYSQSDIVQILLFVVVALVTARLSSDARRLHQLATTDDLTGLHNLRSFEVSLAELVRTSERAAEPLSMLVLDVDRLNQSTTFMATLRARKPSARLGVSSPRTSHPRRSPAGMAATSSQWRFPITPLIRRGRSPTICAVPSPALHHSLQASAFGAAPCQLASESRVSSRSHCASVGSLCRRPDSRQARSCSRPPTMRSTTRSATVGIGSPSLLRNRP